MKKIAVFSFGNRTAKVYRDSEWQEYRVKFYVAGTHMDAADYHTDDREDAMDTAKVAIEDERQWQQENAK